MGHQPYKVQTNDSNIKLLSGNHFFKKDTLLGFRHVSGKHDLKLKQEYTFTCTNDTLGQRRTSLNNNKDLPSIWIFGCSFTYGWAVNDNESFPWLIQDKLPKYNVLNFGGNGYGTIHSFLQLKEALENRNKPKVVVINYAKFHTERNVVSHNWKREMSRWNSLGIVNLPYAKINKNNNNIEVFYSVGSYTPWVLSEYSFLAYKIQKKLEASIDYYNSDEELKITKILFEKIIHLCKSKNIKLLITDIEGNSTFITDFCKKIKFISQILV